MTMVRCARIINPTSGELESASSWLEVGVSYRLISIMAEPGRVLLRIIDRSGSPSVWDSRMFAATTIDLPDHWVARIGADGSVEIGEGDILVQGFWEKFFDGDSDTARVLNDELKRSDRKDT